MKKTLMFALASAMLLFAACTKDEDGVITSDNTWSLNGTEHYITSTGHADVSSLLFTDNRATNKGTLTIKFKSLPAAAGSYQLVAATGATLGDKECVLEGTDATLNAFSYIGTPVSVVVGTTKSGGIMVTVPEIDVTAVGAAATYKFSAAVYEE